MKNQGLYLIAKVFSHWRIQTFSIHVQQFLHKLIQKVCCIKICLAIFQKYLSSKIEIILRIKKLLHFKNFTSRASSSYGKIEKKIRNYSLHVSPAKKKVLSRTGRYKVIISPYKNLITDPSIRIFRVAALLSFLFCR